MSEKQNKWHQLGQAIKELEFITSLFSWIFNFLSRIAEPLMTLSVIYTIIVSGIPHAMVPTIYNGAMAIMIGSPEIILPGAFIMAGQQRRSGNKQAWMLFAVCFLFVWLTSLTLADLFIFHFNAQGTSILMCARCVMGVSYSILIRVVHYEQSSQPSGNSPSDYNLQEFTNRILSQCAQMNQELLYSVNQSQETFTHQFTQTTQEAIKQVVSQIEQTGERSLVELLTLQEIAPSDPERRALHSKKARRNKSHPDTLAIFTPKRERLFNSIQTGEQEGVCENSEHLSPLDVHKNERANREQVCAFILNYWSEYHCKPTIKFIRTQTGCSQGLAWNCCQLLASEMNV